ncbi:glycosyltransferase family 9 protein [Aquimarina brevivitae]|uniref:ADP-heptose:LPS heptosyltransferase n=1 Tax=Aquimarina brevivitae TaxID=323412 RepID=A0A4Q7PGK7_9FLAO|nr:glycosyltransferase family 9 protein [Aquimarina brevivitae]RZS99267.1 ADP-heptose:LPS heptosyltransferase [Aquimarina brevivitae]
MAATARTPIANDAHILVIRLSAMGDVAMTVPVLRTLVATYPNLKITVLTRAFFKPIFSSLDNVEVYVADVDGRHKGVLGLRRLYKELKKLQINAVADLHNVLRSNVLKTFFKFTGVQVEQIDKGRAEKKALTRADNKDFKQLKSTHQRYADVFAKLGLAIDLTTHQFPKKLPLTPKINELIGTSQRKWLGIAPLAQYQSKSYPLDLMIQVIEQLDALGTYDIFLFGGGKQEKDLLNNIASKYKSVTSIVGRLSFEEELQLIGNLDVMLSMDSGNAHLAAMFGIPVITLWGVTHPYAGFMPFGQPNENAILPDLVTYDKIPTSIYGNKFPPGYENVMTTIPPELIVDKLQNI